MKQTITQKILAYHSGKEGVFPQDIVSVDIDGVFSHDVFTPFVIEKFNRFKTKSVWDKNRVYFIVDHEIPASSDEAGLCYRRMLDFSNKQGIKMHLGDGVCHQLIPELGYVLPGNIFLGTDSHSVTYGGLGAFATGIGTTEMAHVWATGKIWLRLPEEIKVNVSGKLKEGVFAKDIILYLISILKSDGATYKTLEFSGDTIRSLSMSGRFTLCNMAVEMGAKNGIIEPDNKTEEYIKAIGDFEYKIYKSDEDAEYSKVIDIDASILEPMVWSPDGLDNVVKVKDIKELKVDQVFIGSCTNGRFEDFEVVSDFLKRTKRKVKEGLRLIITPASRKIYERLIDTGILKEFSEKGAIITNPYCGFCMGKNGGRLSSTDVCVATNNRNFPGRLGPVDSRVFLVSPLTAIASATEGRLVDPRDYI